MKYAVRFTVLNAPERFWKFCIEDGKVKTYNSKEEAQEKADACQEVLSETHLYEVVVYE